MMQLLDVCWLHSVPRDKLTGRSTRFASDGYLDFAHLVVKRSQLISVLVQDGLLQLLVLKQHLCNMHSS